jgi:hypothetical protein
LIFYNRAEISMKTNLNDFSNVKVFIIYLFFVLAYNAIFTTVYLGDVDTMVELAKNNEINEWQMVGGYLVGKFSLLFLHPRDGLFLLNTLFWVMALTLYHKILSAYIESGVVILLLTLWSPLFIFSNIIYKESFPIFFFLLAFTTNGWMSPIFNSVLRVNLFLESLLVYISLFYKEKKWLILVSVILSSTVFISQVNIYNSKNGVINTVLHSYIVGIKIQTDNQISDELKVYYQECREFEQLYNNGLVAQPSLDDTALLNLELRSLALNESLGLFKHLLKKAECVLVNHNRYFLLPSATYRIGSTVRDYIMIVATQLNPFFRPLIGLIFLLIPGTLPLITRMFLVGGLFATIFMHTNPEARYFIPFVLAGVINVAIHIDSLAKGFAKKVKKI